MPFKPGTGGRPKGAQNKASKAAKDVFRKLGGADGAVYAKALHELATNGGQDPHVRLKALALIVPYVWGRPVEHVALEGADGGPVAVKFVDA